MFFKTYRTIQLKQVHFTLYKLYMRNKHYFQHNGNNRLIPEMLLTQKKSTLTHRSPASYLLWTASRGPCRPHLSPKFRAWGTWGTWGVVMVQLGDLEQSWEDVAGASLCVKQHRSPLPYYQSLQTICQISSILQ